MTLVVIDASALVSLLTDAGPAGRSVAEALERRQLAAPALLPFEVANALRRLELKAVLSADGAALAHADLLDLPVQLWPYAPLADMAWRLRGSVTAYDASYVALAATLDVPLLTLDGRLARAARSSCRLLLGGAED